MNEQGARTVGHKSRQSYGLKEAYRPTAAVHGRRCIFAEKKKDPLGHFSMGATEHAGAAGREERCDSQECCGKPRRSEGINGHVPLDGSMKISRYNASRNRQEELNKITYTVGCKNSETQEIE